MAFSGSFVFCVFFLFILQWVYIIYFIPYSFCGDLFLVQGGFREASKERRLNCRRVL